MGYKRFNIDENKKVSFLGKISSVFTGFFKAAGRFFSALFKKAAAGIKSFFVMLAGIFKNPDIRSESTIRPKHSSHAEKEILNPSDELFIKQVKAPNGLSSTNIFSNTGQKQNSADYTSGKESKEHMSIFKPRTRKPSFIIGIILTTIKISIIAAFMFCAGVFGLLWGVAKAYMETTPNLDVERIENQAVNSYIYDADDKLITIFTNTKNHE